MSQIFDATGQGPSRNRGRRRLDRRRGILDPLSRSSSKLAGTMQAIMETLETRPLLTGPSLTLAPIVNYELGSGLKLIDSSASVADATAFDGGSLSVSFGTTSATSDSLAIGTGTNTDGSSLSLATVGSTTTISYKASASATPFTLGTFASTSGTDASPLVVTFSTNATPMVTAQVVTDLIDQLEYQSSATTAPSTVPITESLTDSMAGMGSATTAIKIVGPPSIGLASSVPYEVQSGFKPIDSSASVADATAFDGGSLSVSFGTTSATSDSLAIGTGTNTDGSSLSLATVGSTTTISYKASASATPFTLGTFASTSGTDASPLVVTFSTNATPMVTAQVVTDLIDQLEYQSSATTAPSSSVSVSYSLLDSLGGSGSSATAIKVVGPPTLSASSPQSDLEGASESVPLTGITLGTNEQSLTSFTASTDDGALLSGLSVTNYNATQKTATLNYTTLAKPGTAHVTLTAVDSFGFSFPISAFSLSVAVNDPPTLSSINGAAAERVLNSTTLAVPLTGISAGSTADAGQTLTFTTSGFNTSLLDPSMTSVTYTQGQTAATLNVVPLANAHGTTTITVTLQDSGTGQNSVTRTLVVDVDQAPVVGTISPSFVAEGSINNVILLSGIIPGDPGDSSSPGTVASVVVVPGSVTNLKSVALTTPYNALTGTASLVLSTNPGVFGTSSFQVTVTDAPINGVTLSATETFTVTIGQIDQPPTVTLTTPTTNPPTTTSINSGGSLTFSGLNLIAVADVDAGSTKEVLTLHAGQGTLTVPNLATVGSATGNGTSTLVITDTIVNLNADLADLTYLNVPSNPTGSANSSDQLMITLDDLGNGLPVVNATDPSGTGLIATATATIPIMAESVPAFGTITITDDATDPIGTDPSRNDYLARHPVTYTYPVINTGPSNATIINFTDVFAFLPSSPLTFGSFEAVDSSTSNPVEFDETVTLNSSTSTYTVAVNLAGLTVNQMVDVSFSVTTPTEGTLTAAPALTLAANSSGPVNSITSPLNSISINDAGVVSFTPVNGITANFNATVPVPSPSTANYQDYPITLMRTAVTGFLDTNDPVTVSLNLSGTASLGISASSSDYEIVYQLNGQSLSYTGINPPLSITIPAGASTESFSIRVYKNFSILPRPDSTAIFTLVPRLSTLPPTTSLQSSTVTLKHPQLIVNDNDDTPSNPIFDPSHVDSNGASDPLYSLRGVINTLNAYYQSLGVGATPPAGPIAISFNLPAGQQTIRLAQELDIDVPIELYDPSSNLPVTIMPASSTSSIDALVFGTRQAGSPSGSSGSILQSVTISGFDHGIVLDDSRISVENSVIQGNTIGVEVESSNDIVGYNPANATLSNDTGDTISGNTSHGVLIIGGTNDSVANNTISGNRSDGVLISAGINGSVVNNTIFGNSNAGIAIEEGVATGNIVEGNKIGTDATGNVATGLQAYGVELVGVSGITIGGSVGVGGNVISGNTLYGVYIAGSSKVAVEGNEIGTNAAGSVAVANLKGGVYIDGTGTNVASGNTIGGSLAGAGNVISGNANSGILIAGPGATATVVEGNKIGTDAGGNVATGSQAYGVELTGVSTGTIGGTVGGASNVISGNTLYGVYIAGSSKVAVEGNEIGTNAAGSVAVANLKGGVYIDGTGTNVASGNTIGGSLAGAGNVISGNANSGILIAGPGVTSNDVQDNEIGTSSSSDSKLGNSGDGVTVMNVLATSASSGVLITDNLVDGSGGDGVDIIGSDFTQVTGNLIGLNHNGTAIGNAASGVVIILSPNTYVGVDATNLGNTIGANTDDGVLILDNPAEPGFPGGIVSSFKVSSGVVISSNQIGTSTIQSVGLGNGENGIDVEDVVATSAAQGVNIAFNVIGKSGVGSGSGMFLDDGVLIDSSQYVQLVSNRIGTDFTGTLHLNNLGDGVLLSYSRDTQLVGNVLSNSGKYGLEVVGSSEQPLAGDSRTTGLLIMDNQVGTDYTGSTVEANASGGILITGDGLASDDVVISGNTISDNAGIGLDVTRVEGLVLEHNAIGTNQSGTSPLGNLNGGVEIDSSSGALITSNVISGNHQVGLTLMNSASAEILDNKIGVGSDGSTPIGNASDGVVLTDSPGATFNANTVSSNGADGIDVDATLTTITSNLASSGLTLLDNLIGLDSSGMANRGNAGVGVRIGAILYMSIRSNQVSANGGAGVFIEGATAPQVVGNSIGTSAGGGGLLGNGSYGILLDGTSQANVSDNTIDRSKNGAAGIEIDNDQVLGSGQVASQAFISDNFIGTNSLFGAGLGNLGSGVGINGATDVEIVGDVIVSNSGDGITAQGATNLVVKGNDIGTSPSFVTTLGNVTSGVSLSESSGVSITGNVIGENNGDGLIAVASSYLTIKGNFIGTDSQDALNLGNHINGVYLETTDVATVQANTLTDNALFGVEVAGGSNLVTITGNAVGGTTSGNKNDGVYLDVQPTVKGNPSVLLTSNTIQTNGGDGINLAGAIGVEVVANISTGNKVNGIQIGSNASNDSLAFNSFEINQGVGAYLAGATNISFNDDTIDYNSGDGILVSQGSASVALNAIIVQGNLGNGIELDDANHVTVTRNPSIDVHSLVEGNHQNGILIDLGSQANAIGQMIIEDNLGNGVEILSNDPTDPLSGNALTSNSILGNHNSGVLISGEGASSNTLTGNLIGSSSGSGGNLSDGVSILNAGQANVVQTNTILGNNNNGILISETGSGTIVSDNLIGVNASGDIAGNGNYGLSIDATSGVIVTGDIISNNLSIGLSVDSTNGLSVTSDVITNNQSNGVVLSGTSDATIADDNISNNQSNGLVISGSGGTSANLDDQVLGDTIQDNKLAGVLLLGVGGVQVGGPGRGNNINGNSTDGVDIFSGSSANTIESNNIGTDSSDLNPLGNLGDGVHIVNSSANTIGGVATGQGNVISSNKQSGIEIFGNPADSTLNSVVGNLIGTRTGNSNLGNKVDGVLIGGSPNSNPQGNFIGSLPDVGTTLGTVAGNIIAGNQANGVAVVGGNLAGTGANVNYIRGNIIGDLAGVTLLGNYLEGISLAQASNIQISQGNTISGNTVDGVDLLSSTNATIAGNTIENNIADGVRLEESSDDNFIGLPGIPNVIIGNLFGAGIELRTDSTANILQSNLVGIDGSGVEHPNAIGVYLNSVDGNIVGGFSLANGANTVTGNSLDGIYVSTNSTNPVGNLIQNNLIGTTSQGNAPSTFPGGLNDVGVFVLNSANNTIKGNLVSGNHQAGVELFGIGSKGNYVLLNTIGSNMMATAPILTLNLTGNPAVQPYSASNPATGYLGTRQDYGIWIDGATANTIGSPVIGFGNTILGNEVGVEVDGSTATANVIGYNDLGASFDPLGLGNFFGVYINNTSGNMVTGNTVEQNVSVGIAIVGPAATSNVVNRNVVNFNGGYGFYSADQSVFFLEARTPGALILGTGIYVDSGTGNIIGSTPSTSTAPETTADGNTSSANTLVGIYIYNDGTPTFNANGTISNANTIRSNTANGNGYYGTLLFDASADLNLPGITTGVELSGTFQNHLNGNPIANFREYTGPGAPLPLTVPVSSASVSTAQVKAASVIVKATGKAHPLAPSTRFVRKS